MAGSMVSPMKMSEPQHPRLLCPSSRGRRTPGPTGGWRPRGEGDAGPWHCHTLTRIAGRCSTMPTDGRESCPGVTSSSRVPLSKTLSLLIAVSYRSSAAGYLARTCQRAGTWDTYRPVVVRGPARRSGRQNRPAPRSRETARAQSRTAAISSGRTSPSRQIRSTAPAMPTAPTGMRRRLWMGAATEATPVHVSSTSLGVPARAGQVEDPLELLRFDRRAGRERLPLGLQDLAVRHRARGGEDLAQGRGERSGCMAPTSST